MKNKFVIVCMWLCIQVGFLQSQTIPEFNCPELLSFEGDLQGFNPLQGSSLTLSSEHFKHGQKSLLWKWSQLNASISLTNQRIRWAKDPKDQPDPSTYTFVFWVYQIKAQPQAKLTFEFMKNGQCCSWFEYGLDFEGWRGAWVAYERDMQGVPMDEMDELKITVHNATEGTLFFDHLILSSLQDLRQHTADTQAPFINKNTNSHWLLGVKSTKNIFDLPLPKELTSTQRASINQLTQKVEQFILDGCTQTSIDTLRKAFDSYAIKRNLDGTLYGRPIFFSSFGETYFSIGHPRNLSKFSQSIKTIKETNQLLFQLATTYRLNPEKEERREAKEMFLILTRHLLDQGFTHGSAMGTLHHLGYSMREFFPAFLLMKKELFEAGLGREVARSMEWFSIVGDVKPKPKEPGFDIDTFNTFLLPRLMSILITDETPEQYVYLQSYLRWLNNGFNPTPGLGPSFKSDGTVFHHCNSYPAYGRDGMRGAVEIVHLLSGTPFAVSKESHQRLKTALLTMRYYCNLTEWPLSMSGRHPTGTQALQPHQYALMALAGTPDGYYKIDKEMAAAYLRLVSGETNKYTELFKGILPESSPNGNLSLPYACAMIQRRDNWSVSVRGFSRYLWNAETYETANLYGRYLAFGNLQIQATGNPINNQSSGFVQEGWDWNHWWGTTSLLLPIDQLKSRVLNVDSSSGNEEMLLSDEAFAGGVSLEKKNGLYAMKLHDHDKYGGTLRARKSYFFFDNRIVCLGSDIECKDSMHTTATTLFQEFIPSRGNSLRVDQKRVSEIPFVWTKTGNSSLIDGQGNAYFVSQGTVRFSRSIQNSFDQRSCQPTQNPFSLAFIDHGKAPQRSQYEYAVLVQPSSEEVDQWQLSHLKGCLPYKVIYQGTEAHIVYDERSRTTGYAFFEPIKKVESDKTITGTTHPCLIMEREIGVGQRILSVADPDLRFYEGPADEVYDNQGCRVERSVYSRTWIANPSLFSHPRITLKGKWQIINPTSYCRIIQSEDDSTTLEFDCVEGVSREVKLRKR